MQAADVWATVLASCRNLLVDADELFLAPAADDPGAAVGVVAEAPRPRPGIGIVPQP